MTSAPRLDLEPLYTELKNEIGKNWADYKEATTLFLIGRYPSSRAILPATM